MSRLVSSEKNTHVLKDPVPALKNSLLHTGGLLSGGQLQWMLAHWRQELENQLSALCLTSTTFATERRGENSLHSPSGQQRSLLASHPISSLLEVRKTGVIRSDGQMKLEHPIKLPEYDIQGKTQAVLKFYNCPDRISRHWLCMCTHLGGNKELSECKQLSNTSHHHVKTNSQQRHGNCQG